MPLSPRIALSAFRRRVALGAFFAGALQAGCFVALGWTAVLLAARLWSVAVPPSAWWLLLAIPVLGYAANRGRRGAIDQAEAATFLDRRLGLSGLLICHVERGALEEPWRSRLEARLSPLAGVLPRLRWRRLLPRPLLAAGLCALVAGLPPPSRPEDPRDLPAFRADVERLGEELRDLLDRGRIPEEVERELEQQLRRLTEEVDAGGIPGWREVDELSQRIRREQLLRLAEEARGEAGEAGGSEAVRSVARTEALERLAERFERLGLWSRMGADLAEELRALANPDGTFSFDDPPPELDDLEALAEAFGDALEGLDPETAGITPVELGDLEEALARAMGSGGGEGDEAVAAVGATGEISRGPGHVALSFTESAGEGVGKAMPLPPGPGLPGDWVPVGSRRVEPNVDPVPDVGPGGGGSGGAGGATWELRYAPRHRAVLRRFFAEKGR